jgi:hypothetical protein
MVITYVLKFGASCLAKIELNPVEAVLEKIASDNSELFELLATKGKGKEK